MRTYPRSPAAFVSSLGSIASASLPDNDKPGEANQHSARATALMEHTLLLLFGMEHRPILGLGYRRLTETSDFAFNRLCKARNAFTGVALGQTDKEL